MVYVLFDTIYMHTTKLTVFCSTHLMSSEFLEAAPTTLRIPSEGTPCLLGCRRTTTMSHGASGRTIPGHGSSTGKSISQQLDLQTFTEDLLLVTTTFTFTSAFPWLWIWFVLLTLS